MLHRTKLCGILCAVLMCALCIAMLVGFVPSGDTWQVRRHVTFVVEVATDIPTPHGAERGGGYWAAPVSTQIRTAYQEIGQHTSTRSLVHFSEKGIALATSVGLRRVEEYAQSVAMTPLPFVDDASVVAALLAESADLRVELLAENGQPMRWSTSEGGDACSVSAAALAGPAPVSLDVVYSHNFDSASVFERARRYQPLVERFAARFSLDPALVYAIIHAESSFRPVLVSNRSAMGLMQLLPSTAGGEVHRFLHGETTRMTFQELANPEINIRYGTAYLHLLLTRHLAGVENPLSRVYCAVASYNMGPHGFLKQFGVDKDAAFAKINALSPEELLRTLTTSLPIAETRAYVAKVTRSQENFASLSLGEE